MELENSEVIKNYTERDYRTVWQRPRAKFEDLFEGKVIKKLMPKDEGWFLDLGGGYGRAIPLYKQSGRKIVLVDYAPNLLEMAEKEFAKECAEKNLYLIAANAYRLPFRNNVFSAGVSIRVFHHMNLPQKFLEECGRTFKKGGNMLMEYSNKRNLWRIFKLGKKAFQQNHEEYAELQYGTHPNFFKKISNAAGFEVTQNLGTGFFPRFVSEHTKAIPPLLALAENIFDPTFGNVQLAPMNFSLLQKSTGGTSATDIKTDSILDILVCPACKGTLEDTQKNMSCASCKKEFPKLGNVIDFRC